MIKVKYSNDFYFIEVSGHANYKPHGKDLVCAGVSSIMYGLCNYLTTFFIDKSYPIECVVEKGYIKIDLTKIKNFNYDDKKLLILRSVVSLVVVQLTTIEMAYSDYISISVKEI